MFLKKDHDIQSFQIVFFKQFYGHQCWHFNQPRLPKSFSKDQTEDEGGISSDSKRDFQP